MKTLIRLDKCPGLIRVFAGCTGHFIGFVVLSLIYKTDIIVNVVLVDHYTVIVCICRRAKFIHSPWIKYFALMHEQEIKAKYFMI